MQLEKILILLSVAALGAAENDVEADDVPSACLPACQFTIDLSARCDRQTNSDDQYTPCVCEAQDSRQRLTECASCVKDHGRSDPDDNDVADLMDDCGWDFNDADVPYPTSWSTTTAAIPSSTSAPASASTNPTGSTTTVVSQSSSQTLSQTPSQTSSSSSTTTVTGAPADATSSPDSMAGALSAKTVVGSLLAGLAISFFAMF
ncbi:hypothetical protein GQX73_g245 [Xylaria multiplex]|uniref:Extracellular membrane protein CFEM domain-containing protein n=1 Tax=Xylaria multiplex TaxID=323545 RepID=A0A7C8IYC0_9PEZI|nr:hypothetical protein GQX73_g245 [Xylaria multiplex]